jgi:capsular exopolysaccharide synthesis family protein
MIDMSLLAIVLGGLGGAGAITIAELWNRTVRTRAEVERLLGLSVAGVLPEFRTVAARRHRRRRPQDYLVSQPFSSFAESFRSLYAFLSLRGEPQPGRRIAVTSAIPGEGKSLTCLCLGRAMALSGKRVVAVDCDLRRQGLTRAFGEARRGVVQVVEGSLPLEDALQFDDASGLWLLPATPDAVPEDLFSRPEIDALFERLSREFDYVLLDTPPILGVADARIVSAKADQVLLAVRWDRTPLRTVQGAAQILRDCGTTIAGAVLTRVDVGRYAGFGEAGASPYHRAYRRYFREPAPLEA